ncbi:MAG: MarR family transcriptional regulator, transcriptional regulator for hemolysin, partial [Solirubrobacteraceae bacterium]|nr:MarR family transcriptional regulator, transcriptional regulator for hemolysin [Solirubrobacteraceae bacterium]
MWLILLALKTQLPQTQRELAAAVGIEGATLTHHLDAMQRAGLIKRDRLPENRRVQRVELTKDGERAFLRLR